jgi:hypothetical protein
LAYEILKTIVIDDDGSGAVTLTLEGQSHPS